MNFLSLLQMLGLFGNNAGAAAPALFGGSSNPNQSLMQLLGLQSPAGGTFSSPNNISAPTTASPAMTQNPTAPTGLGSATSLGQLLGMLQTGGSSPVFGGGTSGMYGTGVFGAK